MPTCPAVCVGVLCAVFCVLCVLTANTIKRGRRETKIKSSLIRPKCAVVFKGKTKQRGCSECFFPTRTNLYDIITVTGLRIKTWLHLMGFSAKIAFNFDVI